MPATPYAWTARGSDALALWPIGPAVASADAAARAAEEAGYVLDDGAGDPVCQGGRWCVFVEPVSALRVAGSTVFGAEYVTPLAEVAGVSVRTLHRWLAGQLEPRDWLDVMRRVRDGIRPAAGELIERAERARVMAWGASEPAQAVSARE